MIDTWKLQKQWRYIANILAETSESANIHLTCFVPKKGYLQVAIKESTEAMAASKKETSLMRGRLDTLTEHMGHLTNGHKVREEALELRIHAKDKRLQEMAVDMVRLLILVYLLHCEEAEIEFEKAVKRARNNFLIRILFACNLRNISCPLPQPVRLLDRVGKGYGNFGI